MATTMAEAIKRLTWQFTSEGADKVAADHNKVADSSDALTKKSQTTEKATLDLTKSFEGLERRFNTTIRAQQDYSAVQAKVNEAVRQNPALQERANDTLARAHEHFEKAAGGASGFSKATEIARESMIGFAIEGGAMGAILGSFGPWGIAAAGAITVLREAFDFVTESAKQFGERAAEVRAFAAATGITTTEVRGLAEAGEKAGVGGDRMKVAFERLTVNLGEARTKTGELYEGLNAIDPVLAEQIASARNGSEAWDLLAKSLDKTTDATLKAKTARAAFGRGGVELIPALAETNHEGGIEKYAEHVQHATGVTDELTQATAKQVKEIEALKKMAADTFASIYSKEVLARMQAAAEWQLKIAQAAQQAAIASRGSLLAPSADEFGAPFDMSLVNANKAAADAHPADAHAADSHGDGGHGAATEGAKAEEAALQALNKARLEDLQVMKGYANESARMNSLLGGAATGAEILEANVEKLTAAYLGNQFGAHGSAEALERFQRALHGDTENQISALQDQRQVLEAIGGAAKMDAQFLADYNAQIRAAKSDTDALAIATEKFANAKAAANAGADTTLAALQNALPVAEAWTNAEKMKAQQAATYNQLIRDAVSSEKAGAVAAAQYATAKATAVASAEKLVQSSEDNLDKIRAQGTGMEGVVASGIAYRDAIQAGATATQAAAIAANTLQANMLQAAQAAQAMEASQINAATAAYVAGGGGSFNPQPGTTTSVYGGALAYPQLTSELQRIAATPNSITQSQYNGMIGQLGPLGFDVRSIVPQSSIIKDPINNLTTSVNTLNTSTNNLIKSNQDLLSPYYTQDPRTSHIGFRSQGMATGGWVDVPGSPSANDNMIAQIPVAGGERILVDPNRSVRGGGAMTFNVNISAPVTINGNANKDEVGRTLFQNNQSLAKQMRGALQ